MAWLIKLTAELLSGPFPFFFPSASGILISPNHQQNLEFERQAGTQLDE